MATLGETMGGLKSSPSRSRPLGALKEYDCSPQNLVKLTAVTSHSALIKEACSNRFQFPKTVCAPTRKKRFQVPGLAEPHLERRLPSRSSDLLQVSCHIIWVAVKNAAEKLHNLLIVQVVDTLNNTWQQQLHCQVHVTVETIWRQKNGGLPEKWSLHKYIYKLKEPRERSTSWSVLPKCPVRFRYSGRGHSIWWLVAHVSTSSG